MLLPFGNFPHSPQLVLFLLFNHLFSLSLPLIKSFASINHISIYRFLANELIGGNDSYIACHNGTAKVRFAPEAKIINRKALERNYFEREYSISDFKIDRKGKYKFRINIEDNHNTRDFYIDIMADTDLKTYSGTVYYYGKPQSRIQGTISDLKMEGESQMQ